MHLEAFAAEADLVRLNQSHAARIFGAWRADMYRAQAQADGQVEGLTGACPDGKAIRRPYQASPCHVARQE